MISYSDTTRMDWLEREGHDFIWDDVRPGIVRASDGREFFFLGNPSERRSMQRWPMKNRINIPDPRTDE